MPRTMTDVLRELSEFETADAIAEHFRAEGVRGLFGVWPPMRNCPIARYVQRETGNPDASAYAAMADGSEAIMTFISKYDMRKYPDLIES